MADFASFAALGDSFTEGVGDPSADCAGCRGWADRFAEHLASHHPGLRYANLAIRGKLLGEVLDEQVPVAVGMAPDLVSLAAGGNDLLRPSTDPDDLAAVFETAVARLTAVGATVLVFTGFDPKAFPVLRLIRSKSAVLTLHVREIAGRYGCPIADLWTMRILTDRRLWTPDRLHLTPDGHRRVALLACEVAGIPVAADWRAPLRTVPPRPGPAGAAAAWVAARWKDVEWVSQHAAPYLSRRLHGVSSGDGMVPKRPELVTVDGVTSGGVAPDDVAPEIAAAEGPSGAPTPETMVAQGVAVRTPSRLAGHVLRAAGRGPAVVQSTGLSPGNCRPSNICVTPMLRAPRAYRHRCGMDVRRRTPLPHRCSGGWAETGIYATSMFQQAARCGRLAARAGIPARASAPARVAGAAPRGAQGTRVAGAAPRGAQGTRAAAQRRGWGRRGGGTARRVAAPRTGYAAARGT